MTTLTTPRPPRTDAAPGVTFARIVHSELLKLVSLRSTLLLSGLIVVATVLGCLAFSANGTALAIASGGAVGIVFVAVLGTLSVPVEVNSGTVQPTYLAAPRRVPVLLAKALVVAAVAAGLTILGNAVGLGMTGADVGPDTLGQLLLSGLALGLMGTMFVFAGAMIRSVPAAVTVAILFSILLQNVVSLVRVGDAFLSDFLPSESASGLVTATDAGAGLQALLVLVLWVGGTAIPALLLVRARDV